MCTCFVTCCWSPMTHVSGLCIRIKVYIGCKNTWMVKLWVFLAALLFNWRIIALQNFVVLCHTSIRISHKYIHVPKLPPASHPSACHRAPVWVPWVIQQIPIGYLFYTWYCKFLCYCLQTSPLLSLLLPLYCFLKRENRWLLPKIANQVKVTIKCYKMNTILSLWHDEKRQL